MLLLLTLLLCSIQSGGRSDFEFYAGALVVLTYKIEKGKERQRQREPCNCVDVSCYLYIFTFM